MNKIDQINFKEIAQNIREAIIISKVREIEKLESKPIDENKIILDKSDDIYLITNRWH